MSSRMVLFLIVSSLFLGDANFEAADACSADSFIPSVVIFDVGIFLTCGVLLCIYFKDKPKTRQEATGALAVLSFAMLGCLVGIFVSCVPVLFPLGFAANETDTCVIPTPYLSQWCDDCNATVCDVTAETSNISLSR